MVNAAKIIGFAVATLRLVNGPGTITTDQGESIKADAILIPKVESAAHVRR